MRKSTRFEIINSFGLILHFLANCVDHRHWVSDDRRRGDIVLDTAAGVEPEAGWGGDGGGGLAYANGRGKCLRFSRTDIIYAWHKTSKVVTPNVFRNKCVVFVKIYLYCFFSAKNSYLGKVSTPCNPSCILHWNTQGKRHHKSYVLSNQRQLLRGESLTLASWNNELLWTYK